MLYFILRPTDGLSNSTVFTGNGCAKTVVGNRSHNAAQTRMGSNLHFMGHLDSICGGTISSFRWSAFVPGFLAQSKWRVENCAIYLPPASRSLKIHGVEANWPIKLLNRRCDGLPRFTWRFSHALQSTRSHVRFAVAHSHRRCPAGRRPAGDPPVGQWGAWL